MKELHIGGVMSPDHQIIMLPIFQAAASRHPLPFMHKREKSKHPVGAVAQVIPTNAIPRILIARHSTLAEGSEPGLRLRSIEGWANGGSSVRDQLFRLSS